MTEICQTPSQDVPFLHSYTTPPHSHSPAPNAQSSPFSLFLSPFSLSIYPRRIIHHPDLIHQRPHHLLEVEMRLVLLDVVPSVLLARKFHHEGVRVFGLYIVCWNQNNFFSTIRFGRKLGSMKKGRKKGRKIKGNERKEKKKTEWKERKEKWREGEKRKRKEK